MYIPGWCIDQHTMVGTMRLRVPLLKGKREICASWSLSLKGVPLYTPGRYIQQGVPPTYTREAYTAGCTSLLLRNPGNEARCTSLLLRDPGNEARSIPLSP